MSDTSPSRKKVQFSLDLRAVIILLLVVIGVMFVIWKPWSGGSSGDRSIKVSGEAQLKAEPDEFVFYPSYQVKNADRAAALAELTKKSDEIVAGLKKLGVPDSHIKTNASGSEEGPYYPLRGTDDSTYNLQLTVTANSLGQAQKIQDYLLTTGPTGAVTPTATFSETKRKALENQARSQATKDARAKAEQSARDLGAKLGKVKTVTDGAGFGGVIPMHGEVKALDSAGSSTQLTVQPGENELDYTVTAEFFLK